MQKDMAGEVGHGCLLAHELNHDLNVILQQWYLLGDFVAKDARAGKHVRVIEEAARHMADSIAKRPCDLANQSKSA